MTDSIKSCLDLRSMSKEARREVEVYHAQTKDKRHQNVGDPYPRSINTTSPMSDTGMELTTYWEGSGDQFLQSHITVDLNFPNAMTGQNCEHGTSIFAAGEASLYLLKYHMACDGVPGSELDKLTTHHISLYGATVTYLLTSESESQARESVQYMKSALGILNYTVTGNDSTNETFYARRNGYLVTVYNKTDFSHCLFKNEEVAEILTNRARCIIRIEIYMQGSFLRSRGWSTLESWRNANSERRYEDIFRELVRGLFHLETVRKGVIRTGVILRHKWPRKEAMARLTNTERGIVLAYLAGTPVDELPTIRDAAAGNPRSKVINKWKMLILQKLRIDISISWANHQALKHAELDRLLHYPGDYHPDSETVNFSACKENWPKLLDRIKSLYRKAVAGHSSA